MSPHFYRTVKEIYGYRNVKMFYAGFPTWRKTGYPVYTEPEFLKMLMDEGSPDMYVLVDVREPEKARRLHIPGAVNYPLSKIEDLYNDLPDNKKKTRIIIYSDRMKDAELAMRTLRVNGYDMVSVLNGGIQEWLYRGYPTTHDALKTEIKFNPKKLIPGRVSIKEFEEVIKKKPADKVILDVRSAGEVIKGVLPGNVINIPVDTLDWRWKELSRDKEYLIHCSAGNRARIAYNILKAHGIKARYLYAKVKITKGGKQYSIIPR